MGCERRTYGHREAVARQRYSSRAFHPAHLVRDAPDCAGWNVKGFTLPGAPMIIIGHNDRIAWGFTNNGADVQIFTPRHSIRALPMSTG